MLEQQEERKGKWGKEIEDKHGQENKRSLWGQGIKNLRQGTAPMTVGKKKSHQKRNSQSEGRRGQREEETNKNWEK